MDKKWWKESVVYQIYPRSFKDSNGDGIGDLQGIISKLDYLNHLGVDVVWLCPVYQSPNDDNGYDISNYQSIMDDFGTLSDWEELLAGLHSRGMKLIMDLVVNHSSDEHAWFVESRKSQDNPYRDYYIWRPGKDGQPPNDWGSFFSGSAWELDEKSEEYYLHLFSRKQPDLNWDNPKLRQEIYDMMTWWLDKGIDGFRMDVINLISKVPELPSVSTESNVEQPTYHFGGDYFVNGPRVHEYMQEMNREVLSKYDIMTVGEAVNVTPEEASLYVSEDRNELNMVFHFELMDVDSGPGGKWNVQPWKLADIKSIISKWQVALDGKGWNSLYMNNHDQPRMLSRFGDDKLFPKESGKMLATLLHTLQGTPYIYQGEEIGMTNVQFASIDDYKDIEILNMYKEYLAAGHSEEKIMNSIYIKGRDNGRTPMQWNSEPQAGFTTGTPWLAVNPNYEDINVEQALADPDSIFHYYKKLIELRKQHEIIVYGSYTILAEENQQVYAYLRTLGEEQLLVVLNFFGEPATFELPSTVKFQAKELLIANYEVNPEEELNTIQLRPYEARVYKLN
ncbi:alpha-glucosidase [Paenibacillus sp. FSL R5-0887]|uniref:glycoside hydrolase family 13 protein n=1 Tax=Paenibacillus TaxID=44249 RepID=UPI00096D9BD0|nr:MULTISPECIES: alpha-glucosidase [Paenibacillus]MDH6425504.1 oligo-1,6-glucosidase [Paenibacillus sp. PastH-4]MDH6441524.1 oligo-1,6-glucosidase [Paenibacillus sp. PastF-4]MDH6529965.1 oligo-1,6-glucosidase [Paenibacillus sp. PastH-3]OMD84902.1 glucohydrolase [Paenibacillus odorifer]